MDAQRREEITGWNAREFSDGFADLRRLVDSGFSGAVTDGTGWLFAFEGRVVGTVDAELDAFSNASGTIYKAPHESLPVLFAMQEQGGDPRAQYYTNDTPLSEADSKLSRGGFTGYVELSENVLSGDYYVTYTAGESMAVAYVGNSRRVETGEDAFELADDEVGIYTVYEVDIDVREIPSDEGTNGGETAVYEAENDEETNDEGATTESAAGSVGATGASAADDASATDGSPDETVGTARTGHRETDRDSDGDATDRADRTDDAIEVNPETDDLSASDPTPTAAKDGEAGGAERDAAPSEPDEPDESDSRETADANGVARQAGSSGSAGSGGSTGETRSNEPIEADDSESGVASGALGTSATRTRDGDDAATTPSDEDVFSEEEQWREQKSIPALDPSEASDPANGADGSARKGSEQRSNDARQSRDTGQTAESNTAATGTRDRSPDPRSTEGATSNGSAVSQRSAEPTNSGEARERIQQIQAALAAAESERESLAAERDDIEAERDGIAGERDELAAEVDRLKSEISTLRKERDRFREELSAARERLPETERTISAAEARSGTNLFVRYDSKGGATLEDAHDGTVDRDMLRENLRIEHHTSFETDGLSVDGRPFEAFLEGTIEYGFTRWLVEDLPFEVSETGNQSALRDLYDALPEIDRAEIGGSTSIVIRENGEETREQRTFDLVLRDRMGNPLFVADLNDSRDPTAEGTLESLVGNGRDIAESSDSFSAAFAVTESFFEPGALETASDAVGGGLFSRSKRASFVKLSRKRGYHLCLVEARDGGFHMTVPDL